MSNRLRPAPKQKHDLGTLPSLKSVFSRLGVCIITHSPKTFIHKQRDNQKDCDYNDDKAPGKITKMMARKMVKKTHRKPIRKMHMKH